VPTGTGPPPPPLVSSSDATPPPAPELKGCHDEELSRITQARRDMFPLVLFGAELMAPWGGTLWRLYRESSAMVVELDDVVGIRMYGQVEDDRLSPTVDLFYGR